MATARLILTLSYLLATGWFCGCHRSAAEAPPPAPTPIPVQTVQPHRGPIARNTTLPGEVKAYQQATLYAKVGGYLKHLTVDKGDEVTAGALLAEIEVPELVADLARYKADLTRSAAEAAKCKAEQEVAEIEFKRLQAAHSKAADLVVDQAVDNASARCLVAKANCDMAAANQAVAKANLERVEQFLSFARITAPFSGRVVKRLVDPGAFIPAATSGSAAQNAAIVTLSDFNRVRVQVAVPELEAALLATNQPVTVTVEALPGRRFEGLITRYAYVLDEASKTMLAEIELPNPKQELRPGMYAIVKIGIERKPDVLLLPAAAVGAEKVGAFVYTLLDNKAKKNRVQTGFNDGVNVEIISGVNPDQPVILLGKQTLNDGQAVKVTEAQ